MKDDILQLKGAVPMEVETPEGPAAGMALFRACATDVAMSRTVQICSYPCLCRLQKPGNNLRNMSNDSCWGRSRHHYQ
ncbi:ABC transporter C family member 15 [Pyrus ussuriensis x Pyrus communis]|uniref:ABC transporter C family member 15 n=1 Tax=Pyrus ussuriensis x Pyrus communis TaxID=2448454 RepID=A0A5N5I8X7_9ROSA|nr:ABC transporter C family member 15 [Pyrus ussuriensis x Pyrus communis]